MNAIDELGSLASVLRIEQREDYALHNSWLKQSSIQERKRNGITWFPLKIVETGFGIGSYPFVVVERNPGDRLEHRFQSAAPVSLFSAAEGNGEKTVTGTIGYADDQRMKISFFLDELPDWMEDGKLGVNLLFDTRTYDEMFKALNVLINVDKGRLMELRDVLLGYSPPKTNAFEGVLSQALNESQNHALQTICEAVDVAIVHGPPGTGKTTTLVESMLEVLKSEKQVLVCAPSNAATDHLAKCLAAKGLRVVRLGNLAKVESDNTSLTLDVILQQEKDFKQIKELKRRALDLRKMGGKYKRSFGREEAEQRKLIFHEAKQISREARELESYLIQKVLDDAQVIACTLIGSACDDLKGRRFSTVVIDEAGQGIEPAEWVPILKADRVVMAGDPFQLPPTVKSQEAVAKGLSVTLLEKGIERLSNVALLKTQYRMHESIMAFSNRKFYGGALQAHDSVVNRLLGSSLPLEFIDTAGCGFEEQAGDEGNSRCNPEELTILKKHFDQLQLEVSTSWNAAIISPYRAQVELLRREFAGVERATVNTIDSFQGQERDVVYLSLVRSNSKGEIGFLRDYRRMNVAMTRAKMKLIIIGDSATLGNDRFFAELLEDLEARGSYRTAWEFMY